MKRTLRRYLGTVTAGSKRMAGQQENPWQTVGPFLPGTVSPVVALHEDPLPPSCPGRTCRTYRSDEGLRPGPAFLPAVRVHPAAEIGGRALAMHVAMTKRPALPRIEKGRPKCAANPHG